MTDAPDWSHRFLADAMLGRLGRWLRALGFDTASRPELGDHELVRLASQESRTLLTRDRHLVEHLRPTDAVLIRSQDPLQQLREVVAGKGLTAPPGLFTRCLLCNSELQPLQAEEAAVLVPERSRLVPGAAHRCPACRRVYWAGSHARRMRDALAYTLPEWFH